MKFDIRYMKNGEVYEKVWEINADTMSSSSKIMTAARHILDREFGPNTPSTVSYTLLRVKSHVPDGQTPISQTSKKKRKR